MTWTSTGTGGGQPHGKAKEDIDPLARIAGLAQTVEVFASEYGVATALDMAQRRRGSWFEPRLVKALWSLRRDEAFWAGVYGGDALGGIAAVEPPDERLTADDACLDRIALGFAQVVDAKSPWTGRHSEKVSELCVGIGEAMGFDAEMLRWFKRSALLHDIGKLGVSNAILDKPGRLDDTEMTAMRQHPSYTERILSRIEGQTLLVATAASHHEKLDGSGYHRGLKSGQMSRPVRAMVVADMFEAMTAQRPYRDTMPVEKVMGMLEGDVGKWICPEAFGALRSFIENEGYEPLRAAA